MIIINLRMIYLRQRSNKKLVNQSNISNVAKNSNLSAKLATKHTTKAELKVEQDKIVKLQIHDLSYFLGKIFLVIIIFRICLFFSQDVIC